jgi:hypothetical protein
MTSFTISVVVPVYNSEATLAELAGRLLTTLSSCTSTVKIILATIAARMVKMRGAT